MIARRKYIMYIKREYFEEKVMQENARYQAVLELIGAVFEDKQPADNIINEYLRARKYIGSKDRRFITETVWKIIRNRLKLSFDAGSDNPRRILLTYLRNDKPETIFTGEQYAPAQLSDEERNWLQTENEEVYPDYVEAECPQWLFAKIKDVELLKSLNNPAPADFRINTASRGQVIEALRGEGLEVRPTPYSPLGLRAGERFNLNNCIAYKEGLLEVQDEASQLAAIMTDVRPEHKIIDYCCGAGGKSLAMAYILKNRGKILAHDISAKRLEAIKPRMERLGVKNIELTDILAANDSDFDRFVIDAPCSGSGTWRRSPDAKFRLTPQMLAGIVKTQKEILETAYGRTRIGGRIIYITCSILREENEDNIAAFLKAHSDVRVLNARELWEKLLDSPYPGTNDKYLRLSPLTSGTDGFFVAVLEKI